MQRKWGIGSLRLVILWPKGCEEASNLGVFMFLLKFDIDFTLFLINSKENGKLGH